MPTSVVVGTLPVMSFTKHFAYYFVLLGGPLEGTSDVLLIIRANGVTEIHARLSADSWTRRDLLRIKQIVPWTLRLGSLGQPAGTQPLLR